MSPRPKKALEQGEIMRVAAELANANGIENVTLASLAKALNIKSPSLYNHFDGLIGLKRKLSLYSLEKLFEMLYSNANHVESGEERILAISEAYITFARENPGMYEAALLAPDSSDLEWAEAGTKIVNFILAAIEPFEQETEAAIHVVRGLRSIMHGFASLEQKRGFGLSLDVTESYRLTVSTFLKGMKFRK